MEPSREIVQKNANCNVPVKKEGAKTEFDITDYSSSMQYSNQKNSFSSFSIKKESQTPRSFPAPTARPGGESGAPNSGKKRPRDEEDSLPPIGTGKSNSTRSDEDHDDASEGKEPENEGVIAGNPEAGTPGVPGAEAGEVGRGGNTPLDKLASNQYLLTLRSMETQLKTIRLKIGQGNFGSLKAELNEINAKFHEVLEEFEALKNCNFLRAFDFNNLLSLEDFLESVLIPQLNLYELDLAKMVEGEDARKGGSAENEEVSVFLAILNQENAGPIKKDKIIGPLTLRLMTGASISQIQTGPVHPELVETSQRIKKNNQDLENSKQTFKENGTVTFTDLKFSSGTFPTLVRLKFRVTVELKINGERQAKTIESFPTKPFISMTNTGSQWKDAAGTWLKEECFRENYQISMARLWNYFQKHYLIATKQELNNVKRPLYLKDFEYLIQAKFKQGLDQKQTINQKEFHLFWDWIGPSLKKIRYQKYMLWLFENGYLPGFVTGKEAEDQLKNETQGTFIIRLSERVDGEFVISYVHQTGVRHYLLQPDDMADKKKTLVDFLGQNPMFLYIMQIQTQPGGKRVFYKYNKDKILQKYYKKVPKQIATNQASEGNPYDTRVMDKSWH
uniref:SH2 domain-containing protein n=1 Tax=Arcella intermedia TaxID=1963864 RepID=A0A6B2KZA7_9EUKA